MAQPAPVQPGMQEQTALLQQVEAPPAKDEHWAFGPQFPLLKLQDAASPGGGVAGGWGWQAARGGGGVSFQTER